MIFVSTKNTVVLVESLQFVHMLTACWILTKIQRFTKSKIEISKCSWIKWASLLDHDRSVTKRIQSKAPCLYWHSHWQRLVPSLSFSSVLPEKMIGHTTLVCSVCFYSVRFSSDVIQCLVSSKYRIVSLVINSIFGVIGDISGRKKML